MAKREIKRDEVVEVFRPAAALLERTVEYARSMTTIKRIAELHPEVHLESGRKRLAGQLRWWLLAERLTEEIETVPGFTVLSTENQINGGQFVFGFSGGVFTVKREPHDDANPEDGKYLQEAFDGLLASIELADGVDATEPITVYLAVTPKFARLKVCHATLENVMVIPLEDLAEPIVPIRTEPDPTKPRARAKSTRQPAPQRDETTNVDTADGTPST